MVYLAGGESMPYDRLLIATSAHANTFPIRGLGETLVFRRLSDARAIHVARVHASLPAHL